MLRTTTQRGLLQSAAARSIPARSLTSTQKVQSRQSPSILTKLSAAPTRSFSVSRSVAHPTAKYTASPLADSEYHKLSNHVLDSLTETLETVLEEADIETLEEQARAQNKAATRGSSASEWDIEFWRNELAMWSARYLGHQQAASEQADLAVKSKEVRIKAGALPTDHHNSSAIGFDADADKPSSFLFPATGFSGPKRFDYDADSKAWFCLKEGETSTLHELLQNELSEVFDAEVEVLLQDD
ncbi:related to YFH1 - mitochondrial matrix iron chaperone [Ustilago bromivora]|uniref:Related to YFH1 - mitochondrial matrix iron chaperone n=1 Tax=Ustilago bromivora TaxID=307758 RepID=A0A8H8QT38_9BASI|nr:related to YFH1 - mitochondrial matrix iron chaperone [Ustilago bromivora]